MEISTLFGLPAHPLIVHAVVIGVPLVSVLVALHALVPSLRARFGYLTPVAAVATLVSVPLATGSGEELEDRVAETALVERHTEMGEQLLPWVAGLAVAAVLLGVRDWRSSRSGQPMQAVHRDRIGLALAALALVGAVGSTVQVARIGHSGAEAVWDNPATAGSQSVGSDAGED